MPTSKQRLNLTLPKHLAIFLKKISLRDEMSQSAKAIELIKAGIEVEEGELKQSFVDEILRREKDHKLIPFEKILKKYG
jgi:hypothetical protein